MEENSDLLKVYTEAGYVDKCKLQGYLEAGYVDKCKLYCNL